VQVGSADYWKPGQHSHGVPEARLVQGMLDANGGALDTLIGLIERGPLGAGDVPSKQGRATLYEYGLAASVVVDGEDGYAAATQAGVAAFCHRYGAGTLTEAIAARKASRRPAQMVRYVVMVGEAVVGYVIDRAGIEGREVKLTMEGYPASTSIIGRLATEPMMRVCDGPHVVDGGAAHACTCHPGMCGNQQAACARPHLSGGVYHAVEPMGGV
jgi:hypothetical protein